MYFVRQAGSAHSPLLIFILSGTHIHTTAVYFKTQEDCDKHYVEIHYEKDKSMIFACSKCSYKTNEKNSLAYHIKNMHGHERLKCIKCPASQTTYKSALALKQHIQYIHLDIKVCPHCNTSMSKHKLSSQHLLSQYCPVCKIKCICIGAMTKHKKMCKRKCEICLKEFGGTQLLQHLNKDHKLVDLQDLTWLGDLRNLTKSVK